MSKLHCKMFKLLSSSSVLKHIIIIHLSIQPPTHASIHPSFHQILFFNCIFSTNSEQHLGWRRSWEAQGTRQRDSLDGSQLNSEDYSGSTGRKAERVKTAKGLYVSEALAGGGVISQAHCNTRDERGVGLLLRGGPTGDQALSAVRNNVLSFLS